MVAVRAAGRMVQEEASSAEQATTAEALVEEAEAGCVEAAEAETAEEATGRTSCRPPW